MPSISYCTEPTYCLMNNIMEQTDHDKNRYCNSVLSSFKQMRWDCTFKQLTTSIALQDACNDLPTKTTDSLLFSF